MPLTLFIDGAFLERLPRDRLFPKQSRVRIVLDLPELTSAEVTGWQRRLEGLHNECGCSSGAVAAVVSVLLMLLFLLVRPGGLLEARWRDAGIGFVSVVAAAGLGKVWGIWRARSRFRQTLVKLHTFIQKRAYPP